MIKAIDANMYLYLFVENIAPIQEIDTANCIHFKLNSVVLNIHIDKKDNAKTNIIAFNIYCKRLSKYIFYSSFSLLTFATKK